MDESLFDENFFQQFFELQPQALIWLQPVYKEGVIVDFLYRYANKEGLSYLNLQGEMINKVTVFTTPSLSDEMRKGVFDDMVTVYSTGETSSKVVFNPIINKYARVFRSRFCNGILNTIQDSTEEILAIQQLEKQTKELEYQQSFSESILNASPDGIFAIEAIKNESGTIVDFKILKINKAFTEIMGISAEDTEGKSYLSLYPGSKQAGTFDLNCEVLLTGQPKRKELFYPGDGLDKWFDISVVKWGMNGLVITFSDINDRKRSEIAREQNVVLIQTMLNASLHGKALLEPIFDKNNTITDFIVIAANTATEKQIGLDPTTAIGKTVSQLLPGYKKNGSFEKYKKAYETQKALRYEQFYIDERFDGWFDIYIAPVSNGIVISFANITERKNEALKIQQQKNLLDAILANSPSGISVTEVIKNEQDEVVDGKAIIANEAAIRFSGIPKELYLSKTVKEIDPGIFNSSLYQMALRTLDTGIPLHTQYYLSSSKKWLELSVAKMDNDHLINVFSDITTSKNAQIEVEQFADKLNTVINTSQAGFFLGSPVTNDAGEVVDFRFTMVNQVMASFVDREPKDLIGQLASDWFITYKRNGLFERFLETYKTSARDQFDIHYVGETVEVWANVMTTRLGDELLGSFTDFTPIKKLQIQLEKSVDELSRSNSSLQEFAYAASHDLQEPLRKIHFFSEQLRKNLGANLEGENEKRFERMQDAANRMRTLINDLLEYSKVSVKASVHNDIELSGVVEQVLQDLEGTMLSTGAIVSVGPLPVIKGDERQMFQVFLNLISNALKYQKPGLKPEVTVTSRLFNEGDRQMVDPAEDFKKPYYVIEVTDNGIGFEQEYDEKIFQIFQRLHGRNEYQGTGVGLAIVQKVITNHKGYIKVKSSPGKGSTFYIVLPA